MYSFSRVVICGQKAMGSNPMATRVKSGPLNKALKPDYYRDARDPCSYVTLGKCVLNECNDVRWFAETGRCHRSNIFYDIPQKTHRM